MFIDHVGHFYLGLLKNVTNPSTILCGAVEIFMHSWKPCVYVPAETKKQVLMNEIRV